MFNMLISSVQYLVFSHLYKGNIADFAWLRLSKYSTYSADVNFVHCMYFVILLCTSLKLFSCSLLPSLSSNPGDATTSCIASDSAMSAAFTYTDQESFRHEVRDVSDRSCTRGREAKQSSCSLQVYRFPVRALRIPWCPSEPGRKSTSVECMAQYCTYSTERTCPGRALMFRSWAANWDRRSRRASCSGRSVDRDRWCRSASEEHS